MIKKLYRNILLLLILFLSKQGYSTHAMGGDIWYECNGGNSYTIYYAFYRDCNGVNAPNSLTIDIGSSCTGSSTLTLTQIAGTGFDITPTCTSQLTNCQGGSYPGVEKYVYSATINLSACTDWVFSHDICCRNNAITNIVNPGGQSMYIQATLDNLNFPCNSSPSFSNDPISYVCVGQTFCFNHGAIDVDGDSISFQLVTPFDNNSTNTVNYNAGFNPNQPISSSPSMTFDPQTGDICMSPSAQEVSVTAVVVEQWSNGVLVGTAMRDIQIRVITCSNNIPQADGINGTINYSINACAGSPIVFNTSGFDNDAGQLLTMTWNGAIPGASFTIANNNTVSPVGTFSWQPTLADVSANPYCFTLTVQDDACPLNGTQIYAYCITVGGSAIQAVSTTIDPLCNGGCDGQIAASIIGGTPGFSYSLNGTNYFSSNTFTGLCPGNYSVYVRDTNFCLDTTQAIINNPPPITSITAATDANCFGVCDGSMNISASGGVFPYTYLWTGGATTSNVQNVCAGLYNVAITDANGCTINEPVSVNEPAVLTTNQAVINVSCLGNDGQITLTNSGGVAPYSYNWSHNGGLNSNVAAGLSPGQYTVIVTDANGCTTTNVINVLLTGSAVSNFTYNGNQCFTGNNYIFTNLGSTGLGVTYFWDFGDGTGTSILENPSYSYGSAGTYTVQLTVTDGACIANFSMAIQVYNTPVITPIVIDPFCNGFSNGAIDLSLTGGTAPYNYSWSNSSTVQDLLGIPAGAYSVQVFDNNGCQATGNFTLIDPAVLTVGVVTVDPLCQNVCDGSATASVAGGTAPYSVSWNDPGMQTGANAINLCAGNYSVSVSDNKGCLVSDVLSLANTNPISISPLITNSNCGQSDGEITVSVNNGTVPYNYFWSPTLDITSTTSNISAGSYTVTVTDNNGCTLDSTINLIDNAAPTVAIASVNSVACFGDSTGFATTSVTGGLSPYTYNWAPYGGTNSAGVGLAVGSFSVQVTDNAGCIATVATSISQPTEMVLSTGFINPNCGMSDGQVSVQATGGAGGYTYIWETSVFVGNTQTVTGVSANMYYVFVTDANGCITEDSINLQDNIPIKISTIAADISCNGVCDGTAQSVTSGGIPPYSYQWNASVPNSSNIINLCAGEYIITVTDAIGCSDSDTVNVMQPAVLSILVDTIIHPGCFGFSNGSALVAANGGTSPFVYQWDGATGNQTGSQATNLLSGQYVVLVTDSNGCTANQVVNLIDPLEIILSSTFNDAHCGLTDGSATVLVSSGGIAPFSYSWVGTASLTSVANNLLQGVYTANVADVNNCIQSIDISVGDIPAGIATISSIIPPSCFSSCTGTATVSMSGTGTSPYNYLWNNTNADVTNVASGLCGGGAYTVTVTDANGCISEATANPIDPPALTLSLVSSDANCFGTCTGQLVANASGGTPPYSFLWTDPNQQTFQQAIGLCANINYTATVTDSKGCQTNQSTILNQPTIVSLDSIVTNSHCGQSDGAACVSITGGVAPYLINWVDFPGTSTAQCQNGIPSGTYIVEVTDANDCFKQIGITVTDELGPLANVSAVSNVTCAGLSNGQATVLVQGGSIPYNYLWSANAGNQITPTASNLQTGLYSVGIIDAAGCIASTSVFISEPSPLTISLSGTNPSCYQYTDGNLIVNASGATIPYTYSWAHNSNLLVPFASNLGAGNYTVTVTDANNCTESTLFSLINPTPVTTTIIPTNATCNNLCNGSAIVNHITGFSPYTYSWDDSNQQTGQVAFGLCDGSYNVYIADANGCLDTASVTLTEPTLLSATINVFGNVTCNGACNGFAMVDVSGGVLPYSYQWTSGATTQVAQNLCEGSHSVVITDANGCVTFTQITITQPLPILVSRQITNASCNATCDGIIQTFTTGGVQPYSYQWNDANLQTTATAGNLCAGTYQMTVTDANNCQFIETVTVSQPTILSLVSNTTPSNCGQNNGSSCVNVAGGNPPYSYFWSDPNNQQSACAFNISSGSYIVTVTDGNNCQTNTVVTVNDILGPSIGFVQATDILCNGASTGNIEMNVSLGTLPYGTYQWTDNSTGNPIGQANNPIVTGVPAGCYTLGVIDAAGCSASYSYCVTEPSALNLTVTNIVNASCNGGCDGMATALYVGGTAPYNLQWDNGQSFVIATGLCAGSHNVSLTDSYGCVAVSSVLIDQPSPIATSQAGGGTTSCFGSCDGVIQITTTGGTLPFTYDWFPSVSTSSNASNLCAGTYSVQTIDGNGCLLSSNFNVTSPPELTGVLSSVDATCGLCNATTSYVGSGGIQPYSYAWMDGQTTQTATGICEGIFSGTLIDANGCQFVDSLQVGNIPGPQIIDFTNVNPTCNGYTNGSATVNLLGGTTPFTYNWTNFSLNLQTLSSAGAGTYSVEIIDNNGCTTLGSTELFEPSTVVAVVDGQDSICFGDTTQVWASASGGNGGPYTFNWLAPNSNFNGSGPFTVSPNLTSNYCFTANDGLGCPSSAAGCIETYVHQALHIVAGSSPDICPGDSVEIYPQISGGDGSPYIYEWYINSVDSVNFIGSDSSFVALPTSTVTYYVVLNDGCSLANTDSVLVIVNPTPLADIILLDSAGCIPFVTSFMVPYTAGAQYLWNYNCDSIIDSVSTSNIIYHEYTQSGSYDLCVTVISDMGCVNYAFDSAAITIYNAPIADFSITPTVLSSIDPSLNITNYSQGETSWQWDFTSDGVVDDSVTYNPSYEFPGIGSYQVALVVENDDGCKDTLIIEVEVENDEAVFVPNTFSPNGDGVNDSFYPVFTNGQEDGYELLIFNRWGQFIWGVYSNASSWKGITYGKESPIDTYVWKLIYKDWDDNIVERTGHVNLIR